jgi:hypothetical protein
MEDSSIGISFEATGKSFMKLNILSRTTSSSRKRSVREAAWQTKSRRDFLIPLSACISEKYCRSKLSRDSKIHRGWHKLTFSRNYSCCCPEKHFSIAYKLLHRVYIPTYIESQNRELHSHDKSSSRHQGRDKGGGNCNPVSGNHPISSIGHRIHNLCSSSSEKYTLLIR